MTPGKSQHQNQNQNDGNRPEPNHRWKSKIPSSKSQAPNPKLPIPNIKSQNPKPHVAARVFCCHFRAIVTDSQLVRPQKRITKTRKQEKAKKSRARSEALRTE